MKLILMTNFVLEEGNPSNTDSQFADKVMSYANFLKQPLELWMFVPCDEEGNFLEEPECSLGKECASPPCVKYQQAKERCLFEGFEAGFKIEEVSCFSVDKLVFSEEEVIENLLQYKIIFTLTPTAIKQIGL